MKQEGKQNKLSERKEKKERKKKRKKGRKKPDGGGLARDTHVKHTLKCRHTINSEQEQNVMQPLLRRACTE